MNLAYEHLNIPMVVHPEDLASPYLDELSGMTYLSYFMTCDSPGYIATREKTQKFLKNCSFDNFTVIFILALSKMQFFRNFLLLHAMIHVFFILFNLYV